MIRKFRYRKTHYLMWACAVLYYLYQYVIRVSPSIMMEDIMLAFHVNAHGFASLSALAMYAYSLMQTPAGLLTDAFGAKKVIIGAIISCVIGLVCFASAETLWMASIGRILIGCGSAAAFLGVNKIGIDWFPPGQRAFVFGMTMTAGTIGALNGGAPLAALNQAVGWRTALMLLAGLGIIIFMINALFLQASPQSKQGQPSVKLAHAAASFKKVFTAPQVILIGLIALGIYMSVSVLADLWGVSYLTQNYHIPKTIAAQAASLIYVGLCIGALAISWWSDKICHRKALITICGFMIALSLTCFLYIPHLPFWMACSLLFFIGFCSGAEMLCFALATEMMPSQMSGTITGYINAIVTLGGAFVQQQVGRILDHIWQGQLTQEGLRSYTAGEYRQALSVVIGIVVLCAALSFFLKEKRPHE